MLALIHNASCGDIALFVIRFRQAAHRYTGAACCMNEFVIPDIDADMRDAIAHRVKKDQIADRQIAFVYSLADMSLLTSSTR